MGRNQCPECGRGYRFETDGNGRLLILHSDKPCIPPKYARNIVTRDCINCGNEFSREVEVNSPRPKLLCSEPCKREWAEKWREKRKAEKRAERLRQRYNSPLTEQDSADTLRVG